MYIRHTKILLFFIDAAATWTHAIQMTRFTLMQISAKCCKLQSLACQDESCWRVQKTEINRSNSVYNIYIYIYIYIYIFVYACNAITGEEWYHTHYYWNFILVSLSFLLPLLQVDAFLLTAVSVCIRLFDTNHSIQSLTRKYVYCNWKYNLCIFWSFRYTPGQKKYKIK